MEECAAACRKGVKQNVRKSIELKVTPGKWRCNWYTWLLSKNCSVIAVRSQQSEVQADTTHWSSVCSVLWLKRSSGKVQAKYCTAF
jgi:hypothetical protein